ncbi:MAG: hypothetical protein FE78DRAFT_69673 [Acidomyces sp. 'richmondensis']|nr:MAG: hypothetical protein FE78DRAFT_69673 [Acidomyces sp. 'richmondensis']
MPCYAHVNVRIVLTFKSTGDRVRFFFTDVNTVHSLDTSGHPSNFNPSCPLIDCCTCFDFKSCLITLYFLSKRRPSRQSDGPYGPVMRNDKGADERASYSSPRMLPQEMQNLSPAAPFLPTPAQTDAMAYHGKDSEYHEAELAMLSTLAARDVPVCLQQHTEGLYYNNTSAARPMTSREMYNLTSANIDMVRPATAPGSRCLSKIAHDEPPSPVSPVSPISSAGSRPPSLMQNDYQHDL